MRREQDGGAWITGAALEDMARTYAPAEHRQISAMPAEVRGEVWRRLAPAIEKAFARAVLYGERLSAQRAHAGEDAREQDA